MTSTPSRIRHREDGSREGKLLALKSYSSRGPPIALKNFVVGVDIVSFLAWKHVKGRSGVVVPSLPDRLEGCDFHWSIEMRDDQSNAQQGVRQLVAGTTNTSSPATFVTSYTGLTSQPTEDNVNSWATSSNNSYWALPSTATSAPPSTTIATNNSYWTIPHLTPTSPPNNSYWTIPTSRKRRHNQKRHLLTTFTFIDPAENHPPTSSPTTQQPTGTSTESQDEED